MVCFGSYSFLNSFPERNLIFRSFELSQPFQKFEFGSNYKLIDARGKGRGGQLCPSRATKELDRSKILIIHEPKSQFAVKIEIFKENTFLSFHPLL